MATLKTQPFAPSRAPASWARVTDFLQFAMRKACAVWVEFYVGDCFSAEPAEVSDSSFDATRGVCEVLGLSLSAKEAHLDSSLWHLGTMVAIQGDMVLALLPGRKQAEYRDFLLSATRADRLNPAAAAKLRWKLGFSQSILIGQFGRSILYDVSARQYARL